MSTHVSAGRLDDPEPSPQRVDVGLLTKTGLGTSLLMAILAVVDLIVGDTFDADTRMLIASGIASAIATILARGYQAGKLIAAKHNVVLPDRPLR